MIWLLFCALIAFGLGEVAAVFLFGRVRAVYAPQLVEKTGFSHTALIKGVLERLVLFLGLLMDYAVIIAAFGAFKLGTRLKEDNSNPVSNDYFLVGNLVSLLVVLGEVLLFRLLLSWG